MFRIKSFLVKYKRIALYVFFLILCTALIILTSGEQISKTKDVGLNILSPIQNVINGIGKWFSETIGSVGKLQQTKNELEKTREKLLAYEKTSKDIIQIKQENALLKELLSFSKEINFKHIPAEIIAKQPGNTFSLLILNKGSKDGVRRFMVVVAQNEGLTGIVGKILTVSENSSTVIPIFNESSYIAARVEESRYEGLVNGHGENTDFIIMQNVNQDAIREIKQGDMVITSGMGQVFPKDIYIGTIQTIKKQKYEPSLFLEIKPVINYSKLEYVIIIDSGN